MLSFKPIRVEVYFGLATINILLLIFALFTTFEIPYITYAFMASVLLLSLARGTWKAGFQSKFFLWSLAQVIYVAVTYFVLSDTHSATDMFKRILIQQIVCIFIYIYTISSKESIDVILFGIAMSAIVLSFVFSVSKSTIIVGITEQQNGIYYTLSDNNRNTVGVLLSLGSLFLMYFGFTKNKLYFLFMAFAMYQGLLTGSRKALLASVLGFLLFVSLYVKKCVNEGKKWKRLTIMFFTLLFAFFLVYESLNSALLYKIIGFRIEGLINTFLGNGYKETSAVGRTMMISRAWEMFKIRPLFGWGVDAFSKYSGFNTYSHNNFLEILVSFGLIGFLIIYGFRVSILLGMIKNLKPEANLHARVLICFLVSLIIVTMILDYGQVSINDVTVNLIYAISYGFLNYRLKQRSGYEDSVCTFAD